MPLLVEDIKWEHIMLKRENLNPKGLSTFLVIAIALSAILTGCETFPMADPYDNIYSEIDAFDFDIILVAGQSNAYGYGHDLSGKPYNAKEPIYTYDEATGKVTLETERFFHPDYNTSRSFSHTFAEKYVADGKLKGDRKLLVLNTAVGGTGFCTNNWGAEEALYKRMLEQIELFKQNPNNKFIGILWHQGETDVVGQAENKEHNIPYIAPSTEAKHYNNLTDLLKETRKAIGEALPFISGDFTQDWSKKTPYHEKIETAIRRVMKDQPNCAFVETDEVDTLSDKIHFSKKGTIELGKRYYSKYIELITLKQ